MILMLNCLLTALLGLFCQHYSQWKTVKAQKFQNNFYEKATCRWVSAGGFGEAFQGFRAQLRSKMYPIMKLMFC
jgi:hypothetical protein